jgi:hypothetical protein
VVFAEELVEGVGWGFVACFSFGGVHEVVLTSTDVLLA